MAPPSRPEKAQQVEILSALEDCQIFMGKARALAAEEDRVLAVEPASIVRMTLKAAQLAPALMCLKQKITHFTTVLAGVPEAAFKTELLVTYGFTAMPQILDKILAHELDGAMVRWHKGLTAVTSHLDATLPSDWKSKAVDTCDEVWIKETLLTASLVSSLGHDYSHCKYFLGSFDKEFEYITAQYNIKYPNELADANETIGNARTIVALILVYNCMLIKMPKAKPKEGSSDAREAALVTYYCL